jgi:nitrogen fixation/metabolism regulation signal transduction histidine kinase
MDRSRFLFKENRGSLRQRILAFVGAMFLVSLLGSVFSLYRITEVNQVIQAINHVSVPLGRLFTQMLSDSDVYHRELERSLGRTHWRDPLWHPRPTPRWIEEVLENEMALISQLTKNKSEWTSAELRVQWQEWASLVASQLGELTSDAKNIYEALEQKDEVLAQEAYTKWSSTSEEWKKQLQWGTSEYERSLRLNFAKAESRVVELRSALEMILGVVLLMSLLLLWLGERALRPLAELTTLAREITRRGLRKEDKSLLPEIPISRSDEVSQLAREFHHMATALLEREKMVESQKTRVQEQNRLLREMGGLNENILNSIDSILIVTDLSGKIKQYNLVALAWLGGSLPSLDSLIGSDLDSLQKLQSLGLRPRLVELKNKPETVKLSPVEIDQRIFGGHIMPLREDQGEAHGAILVLDDLTEELNLQERLRQAENLAAVGRMSAQVAHEVRNPLHSIGLEAEMAAEAAMQSGDLVLHQSLQSILGSVDRLQKITENYLKLSRLSDGQKTKIDLFQILQSVMMTYGPVCESQGVKATCKIEAGSASAVYADHDLLEQVLGNLFTNSLQAIESQGTHQPTIAWTLGNTESGKIWLRILDSGPGILPEVRGKLFTPFVTTRAQGTGLGLSFIKKVLEEQGGSIVNIDRPYGSGACFEILLPLIESRQFDAKQASQCRGEIVR